MLQKIFKTYKQILDVKLKDSTLLVFLVSILIISVWIVVPNNSLVNAKNNILELQKNQKLEIINIVNIDGKKYKIYFEEIR